MSSPLTCARLWRHDSKVLWVICTYPCRPQGFVEGPSEPRNHVFWGPLSGRAVNSGSPTEVAKRNWCSSQKNENPHRVRFSPGNGNFPPLPAPANLSKRTHLFLNHWVISGRTFSYSSAAACHVSKKATKRLQLKECQGWQIVFCELIFLKQRPKFPIQKTTKENVWRTKKTQNDLASNFRKKWFKAFLLSRI